MWVFALVGAVVMGASGCRKSTPVTPDAAVPNVAPPLGLAPGTTGREATNQVPLVERSSDRQAAEQAATSSVRNAVPKLLRELERCAKSNSNENQAPPSRGSAFAELTRGDAAIVLEAGPAVSFVTKIGILPTGHIRTVELEAEDSIARCVRSAVRAVKIEPWDGTAVELELKYPNEPSPSSPVDGGTAEPAPSGSPSPAPSGSGTLRE